MTDEDRPSQNRVVLIDRDGGTGEGRERAGGSGASSSRSIAWDSDRKGGRNFGKAEEEALEALSGSSSPESRAGRGEKKDEER